MPGWCLDLQEIPVLLNSHGFYDTFKAYMLGLYSVGA